MTVSGFCSYALICTCAIILSCILLNGSTIKYGDAMYLYYTDAWSKLYGDMKVFFLASTSFWPYCYKRVDNREDFLKGILFGLSFSYNKKSATTQISSRRYRSCYHRPKLLILWQACKSVCRGFLSFFIYFVIHINDIHKYFVILQKG